MKLKVIGLATDVNPQAKNWIKGVEEADLNYKLVGVGQKFGGWSMRSRLYVEEMERDAETDIFILSDVYDVLVSREAVKRIKDIDFQTDEYIIDTFLSFKKPVIVGAEIPCFGNCYEFSFFSAFSIQNLFKKDYLYPNAGLVIGTRARLISLYRHLQKFRDDQLEIGKMMVMHPHIFGLDTHSKLFYNHHAEPDRKRIQSAIFVHFPGMSMLIARRNAYNSLDDNVYSKISPTTSLSKLMKYSIIMIWMAVVLIVIHLLRK